METGIGYSELLVKQVETSYVPKFTIFTRTRETHLFNY